MKLSELICYDEIVIQCHDYPDADTVASGFAVTLVKVGGFGPLYSTSVTFHMAVFCYVLASIVANICAMQRRF